MLNLILSISFNFLLLNTLIGGIFTDSQDEGIYLLTSLKSSVEEKIYPDLPQVFSEEDSTYLWEEALNTMGESEQILQARNFYVEALDCEDSVLKKKFLLQAHSNLHEAWEALNPYSAKLFAQKLPESEQKRKIKPYLMPSSNLLKPILDLICHNFRVLQDESTFNLAGFVTLSEQPISHIRIAIHPYLPGYLIKYYLDGNPYQTVAKPDWQRLVDRCEGAKNIRDLIARKKLVYFTVPDKWLYSPSKRHVNPTVPPEYVQPVFLVVTDMKLASSLDTLKAWQEKITYRHLDELYCILGNGFASAYVGANIPYCQDGKFSCIDTEYPKRIVKLQHVLQFLNPEMQIYWKKLMAKAGKTK